MASNDHHQGYDNENSDLTCEDWRSRGNMWDQSRYALEFFSDIPFWRMSNDNYLVAEGNWCLVEPSDYSYVVIYLPNGGSADIDLTLAGSGHNFSVQWFNPRQGGDLQAGSVTTIVSQPTIVSLGMPPSQPEQDWAVRLECIDCQFKVPELGPAGEDEVSVDSPSVQIAPQASPVASPLSVPTSGQIIASSSSSKVGGVLVLLTTAIVVATVVF